MWFILGFCLMPVFLVLAMVFDSAEKGKLCVLFVSLTLALIPGTIVPSATIGLQEEGKTLIAEETPIVSLSFDEDIEGRFVLGFGHIMEQGYYIYFTEQEDGGLIRGKIKADGVIIYERDETPRIIEEKLVREPNRWITLIGETTRGDTKIIVPPRTLLREFKIN